jgi:hypothetical protein
MTYLQKALGATSILSLLSVLAEAEQSAYEAADCASDIVAEYHGEVARFGDAWVGAHDQIGSIRQGIKKDQNELEAIRALLPPVQGCEFQGFDPEPPF